MSAIVKGMDTGQNRDLSTKVKVLAVDDDRIFLSELKALLDEEGYEGTYCSRPAEAMDLMARVRPACAILDVKMPVFDGQDLLSMIRSKYPEIPVIMCSGSHVADERVLFRSGAFDVIPKPFSPGRLFDALRQAVSQGGEMTQFMFEGFNFREVHDAVSRKMILKALARTNCNVSQAAKLMGMSRQCLLRYIKRLHLSY